MFSASVFVPGKFQLTNQMLSDLRAAGYFEGYGRARYGRRPRAGHDAFAEEVEKIRMGSFVAWREWQESSVKLAAQKLELKSSVLLLGLPPMISVRFYVTGHQRHDPDAWYLLGKPAIDGMARVFGVSDRFRVWDVAGRVARGACEVWQGMSADRPRGFQMEIREVRP